MNRWKILLALALCVAASARAEADLELELETEVESASASVLGGYLDVRPSWKGQDGSFHTENELGFSYEVRPGFTLGYVQEFRTNLYTPTRTAPVEPVEAGGSEIEEEEDEDEDLEESPAAAVGSPAVAQVTGVRPVLADGYLWAEFSNLARRGAVSLTYEPRLYLPTSPRERSAGLVAATRQYFKLTFELSPSVSFFLWEIPVLAAYTRAGFEDEAEGFVANRSFENRVELGARLSLLGGRLAIRLPLILQSLRLRDYHPEAFHNGDWWHAAWLNPEALFFVAENTALGVSYYSESLIETGSDAAEGLRNGVVQVVFQQSF